MTTLRLNAYVKDPNTAMLIVLVGMLVIPLAVRRAKHLFAPAAAPLPGRGRRQH
jgi:hypothetical protein